MEEFGTALKKYTPRIAQKEQKIEEIPASSWDYEKKEFFWKQLTTNADKFEKRYEEKAVEYFTRQEKKVFGRLALTQSKSAMMKFNQSDIEDILISVTAENKIAADMFLPLVKEILEESGNDTMDFLSDEPVPFDANTEALKYFTRVDAMKGLRVMNKVTKKKLRKALAVGLAEGSGPDEIARSIREVFTEAKTVRAERVARTESLKAANAGALEAYKQSGVVIGKEWFTALDEKTCPWCAPLHGKIQAVDQDFFHQGASYIGSNGKEIKFTLDNVSAPPLHPNCRCTLIPVTISQRMAPKPMSKDTDEVNVTELKEDLSKTVQEAVAEAKKQMSDELEVKMKSLLKASIEEL